MFFTRQYDYALRVIRALSGGELLTVKEVCTAEYIPQPYAYKILKKLEKASFVMSSRGVNGGYQLVKDLRDLSLYDIYLVIEGDIYINECLQHSNICPHIRNSKNCTLHTEMQKIQEEFVARMQGSSLYSIFEMKQEPGYYAEK